MIEYLNLCQDSSFLSIILLVKRVLEIICLLVPIILIVMSAIEVGKIVLTSDPKVSKGSISRVIHKMIASIAIFLVPTLVSLLLNIIGSVDYKTTSCWTNATPDTIAAYKAAATAAKEAAKVKKQEEQQQLEETRQLIAEIRENARLENASSAGELGLKVVDIATQEYESAVNDYPNGIVGRPNKYTYATGYLPNDGGYAYHWCASFVSWVLKTAGVSPDVVNYFGASVLNMAVTFRDNENLRYEFSQSQGGDYTPKAGDVIFFSNTGARWSLSHVGIVVGVSGNQVQIIDGNHGDTVAQGTLSLDDWYIVGYGVYE